MKMIARSRNVNYEPSWKIFVLLILYLQLAPGTMLCGSSLLQDSRRDLGAAGETGAVPHLSGDLL